MVSLGCEPCSPQDFPGQCSRHLSVFDDGHAVDEDELHPLRQLVGIVEGRQVAHGLESKITTSAHMPCFNTPRSAKRMRCAGRAENLRIASSRVSFFSSLTYLRRIRGNVP